MLDSQKNIYVFLWVDRCKFPGYVQKDGRIWKKFLEFARDILELGKDTVNYTAEKLENNWKKFSQED